MNILLTKRMAPANLDLIQSWGWSFEIIETLNIIPLDVKEIATAEAWVISSRNSLEAVKKFIHQAPRFIYCVGSWTKDELIRNGAHATIQSFESMKKLATTLANQKHSSILYFCGEEHRQELEEGMKNTTVKILKAITHRSEMTFPLVKNNVDAVFVFSPRSAESLLKGNSFGTQTVFACIGSTTASFVRDHGIANLFIASYPDSHLLLKEFHNQFVSK